MNLTRADKPALILVDIQKGFDDLAYWGGARNNLNAEENAAKLLHHWRKHHLPLFHIQHCSLEPQSRLRAGQEGNDFKEVVDPQDGEPIIHKHVNSAFIGTDLQQRLNDQGIQKVVIVGLTTDQCVSTTTRMAGNFGYEAYVVNDATATFDKEMHGKEYPAQLLHETALASIHQEFAEVVDTIDIIEALS